MFEGPTFTFWNVVYTAIGAMIFWAKWGRTRLKVYALSNIVRLLPIPRIWRNAIEFLVFIFLGCLVGIGLVKPENVAQALTAGLGWTGLLSQRVSGEES